MRLFVGLDMPAAIKDAMAALIERLRPRAPEAKWVPRDNLHVTLSFLGEVKEERVPELEGALADAAASVPGPIPTTLQGSGAFPSARRARVLWVGLEDGGCRLSGLAAVVTAALEPLGFLPEKRTWAAHLTLARFRIPGDARELLEEPLPDDAFEVGEATLFRSKLARPAPAYEPLRSFPLGG